MGYPEELQAFSYIDANVHDDINDQKVESIWESERGANLSPTRQRRPYNAYVPDQCTVMERLVLPIRAVSLLQLRVGLPCVLRDKSHSRWLAVSCIFAQVSIPQTDLSPYSYLHLTYLLLSFHLRLTFLASIPVHLLTKL